MQVEEDMDKVIAKKGVDPNDVEVIVISRQSCNRPSDQDALHCVSS